MAVVFVVDFSDPKDRSDPGCGIEIPIREIFNGDQYDSFSHRYGRLGLGPRWMLSNPALKQFLIVAISNSQGFPTGADVLQILRVGLNDVSARSVCLVDPVRL